MKKRWLTAIIMAVLLLAQAVVVCGGALAEGEEHVHTPSGWKHDEFTHWRVCTECGETLLNEVGEHVLEANDRGTYSCVCGYEEDHPYEPDTTQWVCDEMTLTEFHYQPCKVCGSHHGNIEGHEYPESPDSSGNFVCAKCGYSRSHVEHKWKEGWDGNPNEHFHMCEYEGCYVHDTETAGMHTWQETENGKYVCTTCGYEIDHEHEAARDWSYNDENHWHACTHEGCEWRNDFGVHTIVNGKCKDCGYEEHEHVWSAWESKGTYHERHCTAEGCDEVEKVEHDIPCEICGDGMHKHAKSEEWVWDDIDHWHYCTVDGCSAITDVGAHELEDDENGGVKCAICGYTRDHKDHDFSGDWIKDDVVHWHVCTIDGCNAVDEYILHTMIPNAENNGFVCSVCGYECSHKDHLVGEWNFDDEWHWIVCAVEGCNAIDSYSFSKHKLEDDDNGGVRCKICGYTRDHKEHQWSAWESKGTYHERHCTVEGCDRVEKASHDIPCEICGDGMPEHTHEWSEWEGHGTYHERHCTAEGCDEVETANHDVPCTICGYGVQPEHTHEWSEWEGQGTYHERHCTAEGCDEVETANHDVPCTICGYGVQPEHTHEWSEWEGHGTYHERHCTAEGCDEVETANHDVPCEICGYGVQPEHTHEWSEWEGHGTYHERHCTAEGCDEVETANHDVPCTICGYGVQPEHTFSDEWSYDEVDHWHACTKEGCNWTKDQAEHEWSDWEGHGTYHERHCTVCQKTEQENHELPDGRCDKCDYTMHGAKNEWKYDETNHWHECLFEGCTEKLGEAKHNFVNGVCECGYKQQINNPVKDEEVTPVAPAPLPPQTGDASWLAAGIGMIAAAVCIALRKKQSN